MSAQLSEIRPVLTYTKERSEVFHATQIIKAMLSNDKEAAVIADQIACNITQERLVAVIRGLLRGDRENVFALMLESFSAAVSYVAMSRAEAGVNDEQDARERQHNEMMARRLF